MNTIVPFDSPESPRLDQVGGKALSLITMSRAGMPVPPGFVLTVDFFAPWTATLQATPEWNALLAAQGEELNRVTRTLQAVCRSLQLTDRQREELENALAAFQSDHHARLFAVRSSSPEEDLEGASFAGGYETTLGVTTETLEAAIRHSFASSFDARGLALQARAWLPTRAPAYRTCAPAASGRRQRGRGLLAEPAEQLLR